MSESEKILDYSSNNCNFSKPIRVSRASTGEAIIESINKLPIEEHIKKIAINIYTKCLKSVVHRGKKRQQLIFFCIYAAKLEYLYENPHIQEDVDPSHIGKMVGLKKGDTQRAMSMFSETQTGYRPKTGRSNPLGLIPSYCSANCIRSEMVEPIRELGKKILEKDPSLYNEYPQTVAAGLIRYAVLTQGSGNEIDNEVFSKKIGLSQATITGMYRRISEIDNAE